MRRQLYMLALVVCFVGSGFGEQKVPQGLYDAIHEYLQEDRSLVGNLRAKGFDTNITASEIDVGVPVQFYHFKFNKEAGEYSFNTMSLDAPVMSLVEPTGGWMFNLKARGQYLFGVFFREQQGVWDCVGSGFGVSYWAEFREVYPESTGISPVLIGHAWETYLHVPEKGEHNLTYTSDSSWRARHRQKLRELKSTGGRAKDLRRIEGILSTVSDTYGVLVDSRKVLQYLRDRYPDGKPMPSGRKGKGQ